MNPINSLWAIVCRKSAIDKDFNHVVIGEVIEDILFQVPEQAFQQLILEVEKKKHVMLQFEAEFVSLLEAKMPGSKIKIQIAVQLPSGENVVLGGGEVISGDNGRTRVRLKMGSIPVSGTGRNIIKLSSIDENGKDTVVAEVPVFIKIEKKG